MSQAKIKVSVDAVVFGYETGLGLSALLIKRKIPTLDWISNRL